MRETTTSSRPDTFPRRVPPYHLILENDERHSHTFVVSVLCKALGHPVDLAYRLMLEAHLQGRAVVWTAPREVAELKAEQMATFREDPHGPLDCTIEPAA